MKINNNKNNDDGDGDSNNKRQNEKLFRWNMILIKDIMYVCVCVES